MYKKIIASALAVAMCITLGTSRSSFAQASGTERSWSLSLPHENGNYYYPFRTKETNEKTGYVEVGSLSSSGVNVWFNKGEGLQSAVRITDVVKFKKACKKDVIYKTNYSKGKKVDMGIENADATILFRDKASGIVNYK